MGPESPSPPAGARPAAAGGVEPAAAGLRDRAADRPVIGTNREALGVPAFRRLAVAWAFSNFGDSALFLTAAIWVKILTGSDAAAGMVFAALGLPALLAPLTGQLADRFRRKTVLIVNNLAAAVVVLVLLLVQSADQLWLIYTVIFLYANSSYVTAAAQSGLLRDLLPNRLLAPANGMLSSIDQGLRIVSPLLGAGMLTLWGMGSVIVLTSACFLLSAGLLGTVALRESRHEPGGEPFWSTTMAGFRFLAAHPLLRPALLCLGIAVGASGVVNVTVFATTEQGLGMPPETLGILLSLQGLMAIVGGLTASMVIRRLGYSRSIMLGVVLLGVAMAGTATSSWPVILLSIVLVGISVPWAIIAYVTVRQQETPARMQGRTSAATNVMINVPQVGASTVTAVLIGVVDYRVPILASAAVCVLAVLPLLHRHSGESFTKTADPARMES